MRTVSRQHLGFYSAESRLTRLPPELPVEDAPEDEPPEPDAPETAPLAVRAEAAAAPVSTCISRRSVSS